jgi:multiple sugar transport system substrate-binding protein
VDLLDRDEVVNPSDAEQSGVTDALAVLAEGRAAMVPYQSSGRGYLSSVGFDDYAVAPLPLLDPLPPGGAPVSSFVAGTNLAVFAATEHRHDALELVRFLTSEDEQVTLNAAFKTLPVVESAYADPAFADPATQMFGTILRDHAESVPMVPGEAQMEQLLGGAISQLWAKAATGGDVTDDDIAAALRDADRQMPE